MKRLSGLLLAALVACGPSPEAHDARAPGALVVVVRQGSDRVPFRPDVARIAAASAQLADILGHAIAIELDGAMLPQTHEGAQEAIADLVEAAARDMDDLAREAKRRRPEALAHARAHFRRLVVRYDPAEAARRGSRASAPDAVAELDVASGTVDIVVGHALPDAMRRGRIAGCFQQAASKETADRYARVHPEQLPVAERLAWLAYHERSRANAFDVVGVRGAIWLARQAPSDIASAARAWIFQHALAQLRDTYQRSIRDVAVLPPDAPFCVAEKELVQWLNAEHPAMSLEERGTLATAVWPPYVVHGEEAHLFEERSFPGFERMGFAFTTIDLWVTAGHPSEPKELERFVAPVAIGWQDGHPSFRDEPGRRERPITFYEWIFQSSERTATLAKAAQRRADERFTATAFHRAKALLPEAAYVRFLQSFEADPAQWRLGAFVVEEELVSAEGALFEEARRLWRDVPWARGHALLWFGLRMNRRSGAADELEDVAQDHLAERADYEAFLDTGWPAMSVLPAVWPLLPKRGRVAPFARHAEDLLAKSASTAGNVVGASFKLAQSLCGETSPEAAELRAWASAQRQKWPGAGFAAVADEANCASPTSRPAPPPRRLSKAKR